MLDSISSSLNGALVQQASIEVAANNLANLATPGFKASQVQLQESSPKAGQAPGTPSSGSPMVAATARDFSAGYFQATLSPQDFAIQGDGFFEVTLPDGTPAYTRNGSFKLNGNGQWTTSDDLPVQGAPSGMPTQLARFTNPQGLKSIGNGLFTATDGSGPAQTGAPGREGFGSIVQGFLEGSNVNETQEAVNLLVASRAYEMNLKALKIADKTQEDAIRILG